MRTSDILIVDDEIGIRDLLSDILQDEGYTVCLAENAEEARQLRNQTRPALVLLDIWMPDCDGITLLKEWSKNGQLTMPVVMMSGHASIDTAAETTKIGAVDFLEKPISLKKLLETVEQALQIGETQQFSGTSFDRLGNSPCIQEMNRRLETALSGSQAVLLTGENGSPFKTVAAYFHKPNTPWVEPGKVEHIVDIPMELLQKAAGGILYLDDIAQYSKNIQQGIHFLLGKAEKYNVRMICARTRCPNELSEQPNHDAKLFTFSDMCRIPVPPLRAQAEDIAFLVTKIATELADTQKIPVPRFQPAALNVLSRFEWPGNFCQLSDTIRTLALENEHQEISETAVNTLLGLVPEDKQPAFFTGGFNFNQPLRELREEVERHYFEYHIAQEGQNMSRVAQKVGLERTHLYRKLKQLSIHVSRRSKNGEDDE